jgi:hypothetical protein
MVIMMIMTDCPTKIMNKRRKMKLHRYLYITKKCERLMKTSTQAIQGIEIYKLNLY